jgi:hypothetical protein
VVVLELEEVKNEVLNLQILIVDFKYAVARIVVIVRSDGGRYELNYLDVGYSYADRREDVYVVDVCTYRKKVVLLVGLYNGKKGISVLLNPKLLQDTGVVIIAREDVSLGHKLFPWVLRKYS